MDDFCLETYLIPNLFQIGREKYFCKIYDKDHIAISIEPYCYLVEWHPSFKNSELRLRKSYACYQNLIHDIKAAIYYTNSIKKENNMNKYTLETDLFGILKENNIYYGFINGVYNPEKIVIKTKTNYDICTVRSIPYSESFQWAYEVNWVNVPSYILADLKIDRIKKYRTSGKLIADILSVERELKPIEMKWEVRTYAEADVLATEALYKYRAYGIVDVIFNDPATIIIWADGTKTVVKAENEKFDPEKGLAMAISKKVLGNKHDYYEVFKKYVGRYENKQKKGKKEN